MSKLKIVDRRSEESIMSERNLLSTLNHSFIVNMYFAFQDFYNLYLVMDLLTGGDLRYHISYKKTFTEQETKFFISNMILALEYIHSKNIIHRDIKPENLVLESNGYLRITDFGVAKINEKDNSSETSGTPGYMAPEVILILNHTFVSDFFALGVIGYEFMLGYRPYLGSSRNEIKQLIISKQARIDEDKIPGNWSIEATDFINKLLLRKAKKRLGANGIIELKNHIWMKDVDWESLELKKIKPPFVPEKSSDNFDRNYCEEEEEIGEETVERYKIYAQSDLYPEVFKNYTYCNLSYISNYHIKRLKRFKENNKKIKDIIEQNVKKALKDSDKKKIKESNSINVKVVNKDEKIKILENKINKNTYNISNLNNNTSNDNNKFNFNIDKKNRSKSVEEVNKYNVNQSKENIVNDKIKKEEKEENINNNNNIDNEQKNEPERNIININNQYNNNINNNFFTIDASRTNSKLKRKIITDKIYTKNLKLKEKINNFNEKIIYNNYINLHFNDFSSNQNNNNINIINSRDSVSLNKKNSNNTKKIKPIINIKRKQISKIKKNIIVKSNSMKMMQNNKNILDYILSLNREENNPNKLNGKNILKINRDGIKNYENKSDIVSSKKDQKSPKINILEIKNKKTNKKNLLMDIINNNNFRNVKINRSKIIKNKTYTNRIGKSHSSLRFFNTEKISSIQKKNNSHSKLSKTNRAHISMNNISNSKDYYHNLIDRNYNNVNVHSNYSKTKPKKNIRLIYSNKNYNTFLSINYTNKKNKNKKIKEIKSNNSHKLSLIDSKTNDKNSIKNSFDYVNKKKLKKFIHKNSYTNKRNDKKNKSIYNNKYFDSL